MKQKKKYILEKFDLGIAYCWEYDEDFVDLIEQILQKEGLSTFRVKEHNLLDVQKAVVNKKLFFNTYLDRAADVDENFENFGKILTKRSTVIFNPYKIVAHAIDKASMHLEFITAGLLVPYSIIIPPFNQSEVIYISLDDLAKLGRPFIIKPCNTTGGGIGVVTGAETLKEVLSERKTNLNDKYLIQEKIYPKIINGKRAWFRVFWAFGEAVPVWWNDETHIYNIISEEELKSNNLKKLISIGKIIAKVTKLDFFSTEVVLTNSDNFVVIDYVNDQCDMRFQSKHADGVPDEIIIKIIDNLKVVVKKNKKRKKQIL